MAAAGEVIRQSTAEEVVGGYCVSPAQMGSDQELHVLAVDDSYVDRKVIERLLRISSCKVTAVDSGIRALQYLGLDEEAGSVGFNDLKVNLIITDYSMPGMTGYELLKKIKGSKAFREVPVVIMSSENVVTRVDRCLEEGAEDFIVKPVKLSDVKRLKEFVIRGEVEERKTRKNGKRKFQEDCIPFSPQSAELSASQMPVCEASLSILPSSLPPPTISLLKRPKLLNGGMN